MGQSLGGSRDLTDRRVAGRALLSSHCPRELYEEGRHVPVLMKSERPLLTVLVLCPLGFQYLHDVD